MVIESVAQKKAREHNAILEHIKTMADLREHIARILPEAYRKSYEASLASARKPIYQTFHRRPAHTLFKRIPPSIVSKPRKTRPSAQRADTPMPESPQQDLDLVGGDGSEVLNLFDLLRGSTSRQLVASKIQSPLLNVIQHQPWYGLNKCKEGTAAVKEFWTATVMVHCDTTNRASRGVGLWNLKQPFEAFFPATDIFHDKWFRCLTLTGPNADTMARLFVQNRLEKDIRGWSRHRSMIAVIGIEAVLEVALVQLVAAIVNSKRAEPPLKTVAISCGNNIQRPHIVNWCDTEVNAVRLALQAREYLFDLCARVSCLIAIHSTVSSDRTQWRLVLRDHLKDHEIDGLASTWLASMSDAECPRAGVCFDWSRRTPSELEMLMVAVFISAGISVWMRWPFHVDMALFGRFPWMERTVPKAALVLGKQRPFANPTQSRYYPAYNWKVRSLVEYLINCADFVMYRLKTAPPSECREIEDRIRQVLQGKLVSGTRVVMWEKSGRDKWLFHEIPRLHHREYIDSHHGTQLLYCPVLNVYYIAPGWKPIPGYPPLRMLRLIHHSDPAFHRRGFLPSVERFKRAKHMIYPFRSISDERFRDMLSADHARVAPQVIVATKRETNGYTQALSNLLPGEGDDMTKLYTVHGTSGNDYFAHGTILIS
jgi:hypothetical protein